MKKLSVLVLFLLLFSVPAHGAWLTDWSHRAKVTINSSKIDTDVQNFPVFVDLEDLTGRFFQSLQSDTGADIRVTKSDGSTLVPREVVFVDSGAFHGELYFKAPDLPSGSDTSFFIYSGNDAATSPLETDPNGKHAVWSNGYTQVLHLHGQPDDGDTLFTSTSNGLDGKMDGQPDTDLFRSRISSDWVPELNDAFIRTQISYSSTDAISELTVTGWWQSKSTDGDFAFTCDRNEYFRAAFDDDVVNGHSLDTNDGSTVDDFTSGNRSKSGSWWFGGFVYDGSAGEKVLFQNNVITGRGGSHSGGLGSGNTRFCMWGQNSEADTFGGSVSINGTVGGILDELRYSETARSDSWVRAQYWNQSNPETFYTAEPSVTQSPPSTPMDCSDSRTITLDASAVVRSVSEFPVMAKVTDSTLTSNITESDSMHVTNESDTRLAWEFQTNHDTQGLIVWVYADSLTAGNSFSWRVWFNCGAPTHSELPTKTWRNYHAVYHMDGIKNGDDERFMVDATGRRQNHFIAGNNLTAADDVVGGSVAKAIDFSGSQEFFKTGNPILTGWKAYSEDFLLKTTDSTDYCSAGNFDDCMQVLGDEQQDDFNSDWNGGMDEGKLFVHAESGGSNFTRQSTFSVDDGEWGHVSFQRIDGSDFFFWNEGDTDQWDPPGGDRESDDLNIGGAVGEDNIYLNGTMDELRVWRPDREASQPGTVPSQDFMIQTNELYVLGSSAISVSGGVVSASTPTRHYSTQNGHYETQDGVYKTN